MKFEFSAVVKGVPAAEVKCNLECTADELSMMLSDPVYQELGHMLVAKLQQTSSRGSSTDQANREAQQSDRFEHLRRTVEAEHKCQCQHNKATNDAIKSLQDQFSRMLDRIITSRS